MELVDAERSDELYAAMRPGLEASGGSAANTAAGLASFGGAPASSARCATTSSGPCSPTTSGPSASRSPSTPAVGPADRPVPHRRDARRRAHAQHLPRHRGARDRRRHRRRARRGRRDHVLRGLPLGPRADEGGHPSRRWPRTPPVAASRSRCRTRSASTGIARSSSSWRAHRSTCCSPTRRRSARSTRSTTSTRPCSGFATTSSSPSSPGAPPAPVVVGGDEVHVIDAHLHGPVVDTTGAGDQFAAGVLHGLTHGPIWRRVAVSARSPPAR